MFDRARIEVKAGSGGNGAISFRREKFVPLGGPDGGDGGDGGDVLLMADPGVSSLRMLGRKRVYRGGNGEHGKGQKKHGRRGRDLVLRVPVGTLVLERMSAGDEALIADCQRSGQTVVVARGGGGGQGNTHYASSTNQAPRIAQQGEAGEEKSLRLEMRLIADVGIVGYPNAGKSALLAAASAARPKIASYPFTTLEPVLGVVEVGRERFTLAEIPGLVKDAHLGRGLGHDFLRHIMRTKILIHLIDGASASPVTDMAQVNTELSQFDASLGQKAQLVVVNKIDLAGVRARRAEIEGAFRQAGTSVHFVSAIGGEGVAEVITAVVKMLKLAARAVEPAARPLTTVFRPQPRGSGASVRKEGDTFVVTSPELERIVTRVAMANPEVRAQVWRQLVRLGVGPALEKAGAGPGSKVRCGGVEWVW